MFIDSVKFSVKAGKGGAGCSSFRREKYVPLGGPDGGDGGDGGDVYMKACNNTHTLSFYKGKRVLSAKNGDGGKGKKMNGKRGEDLYLIVPPGTAVYDEEEGEFLFDLLEDGECKLFLKGGKGGLGNVHFKSSTNQRPDYAQKGLDGEKKKIRLELKLIADVGLAGFPNVGKSTLISTISNAKPEVANYEFTTLIPHLGYVEVDEYSSFVMADIPGIIKGASSGRGLGLKFLKHIERTKLILFVLDLAGHRDLKEQFKVLRDELSSYFNNTENNKNRAFAIVFSRVDATNKDINLELEELCKEFDFEKKQEIATYDKSKPFFVLPISSATNYNIKELKFMILELLRVLK